MGLMWEYKAVSLGADDEAATDTLNGLATQGWDCIGPLGNGMTGFRRPLTSPDEPAALKELALWQGEWQSDGQSLIIRGDRWWWGETGQFPLDETPDNFVAILHVPEQVVSADLHVADGRVCRAVFRLDGDTLHYAGNYGPRPAGFDGSCGYVVHWRRAPTEDASATDNSD